MLSNKKTVLSICDKATDELQKVKELQEKKEQSALSKVQHYKEIQQAASDEVNAATRAISNFKELFGIE